MALFLEALEGPATGQKFRLSLGLRVGRSTGEIILADPKVSALHAQFESNAKGQLLLVDRGSSNGLRINGKKVQRIAIMPGVKFQIGSSLFKVIEMDVEPPPLQDFVEEGGWKNTLRSQIPKLSAQNHSYGTLVQRFDPIIQLDFVEGIQLDTKLVLGYGPRKAGSDVLDIELQDPSSPDIAFELLPEDDGMVRFRTAYPGSVLLNEGQIPTDILKTGDQIRVGATVIEVKFLT